MKSLIFSTIFFAMFSVSAQSEIAGKNISFTCVPNSTADYQDGVEISKANNKGLRTINFKGEEYKDVCTQNKLLVTCPIEGSYFLPFGYTVTLNLKMELNSYGNNKIDRKLQKTTPSFQGKIKKQINLPGGEGNTRIYCNMHI